MSESTGLLEGSLAVVLHPAVLAQEGGGEADGEPQLEGEAVDAGGEEDGHPACKRAPIAAGFMVT